MSESRSFTTWFEDFLKSELAPYPGRGIIVARMVVAATITMILVMTFRVHGGPLGALYAFVISRENLRSTFRSGFAIIVSYVAALAFVLVSASIFADQQSARILWFACSMFLIFFGMRTIRQTEVGAGFAVMVVNALPIWQIPQTAEYRVEHTLWQALAVGIGTAVTISVEAIFHALWPRSEIKDGLSDRLKSVQALLLAHLDGDAVPSELSDAVARYSMVGMSGLRRELVVSGYDASALDRWNTIIALVGRTVDLAASAAVVPHHLRAVDRDHLRELDTQLQRVIILLDSPNSATAAVATTQESTTSSSLRSTQLLEMNRSLSMLASILEGSSSIAQPLPAPQTAPEVNTPGNKSSNSLFLPDAFRNNDHVMFAARGCLAATLCYIIYELLDWRGLSTSVTTCVITALSTAGASRQKQVLRFGGAVAGGLIVGMGSQVFVLPYIDSIASFSILFAIVTAAGAWIGTSSTRLAYFGAQFTLAFYLITLQEFTIQTSLAVARDRVIGIILGLLMMWLIYDGIGATTAADAMVRAFCVNLRTLAELCQEIDRSDLHAALDDVRTLREKIRAHFDEVNSQADGIPFEFGLRRQLGMARRNLIRRWQPRLRIVYLFDVACLQHRLFEGEDALPASFWTIVGSLHRDCANLLFVMADHLEGKSTHAISADSFEPGLASISNAVPALMLTPGQSKRAHGVLDLTRQICNDLTAISHEVLKAHQFSEAES